MSFVNYETRDIRLKVVFYGPSGSGKSSMLQHVYEQTKGPTSERVRVPGAPDSRDDTYYDLLPLRLGDIRGFSTHIELWTVPGAADCREARRSILESVDGVVFVADSRAPRVAANQDSIEELTLALRSHSYDPAKIPLVLACGHADAFDAAPPQTIAQSLLQTHPDPGSIPLFAVDAIRGPGVFESLKAISKLVLTELKRGAGA